MSNSGALSGAAQGAAAGSAFGPWGAAIGGIVGGIGGMFSDDAAEKRREAQKLREKVSIIQSFLQRRAVLQNFQLQRAATVSAGLASGAGIESSGIQGAIASAQTQVRSNLAINAAQIKYGVKANKLDRKAQGDQGYADIIGGAVQAVGSFGGSFGSMGDAGGYSASAQRAGTGTYQPIYGNTPIYSGGVVPPTTVNSSPFII